MATLGKPQRQHRIARLLEEQAISSQAQLVELLAAERRGRHAGDRQPRPRGPRRGEGADPRRDDGLRDPRALQGGGRARRPPPPGDGGVRGRRGAHRQPRRAAHAAGLGARRRLGARPRRPPGRARDRRRRRHPARRVLRGRRRGTAVGSPTSRASRRTQSNGRTTAWPKRVVLAYSGGLDTSVAVKWIQEEWGAEVVALAVDVGQGADDDWETIRHRALAAGAIEADRRRRARRVRRGLRHTRAQGQRALRGQVPARVVALASGDRPASRRRRPRARRRRGRARLHRQGQRPGAVRSVDARARARPRGARAGPGVGLHPRGLDRVRGEARHPDHGVARSSPYSVDENMWAGRSSAATSRTRGSRRPRTCTRSRRPPTRRREPRELVIGFEAGVPVTLDGGPDAAARARRRRGRGSRRVRVRSHRHGREPAGRHQEPRDLRVPGLRSR